MVRHIVMWKLRGPSAAERRAQAEQARAALLGMVGKVPGLKELEVGIGSVVGEQEMDLVLSSLHESWEDLATYANHPAHEPVKALIGTLRTERRVIDFEL
jgi:Stress responsive A/B Barrel Domain